jgi:hypothetical protein
MRRAFLAAVAVAPLLAGMAGAAYAACPSGPGPTNGSDVELPSNCTVTVTAAQPGVTVNSSNKVTVDSGATITSTDVDGAVGIKVLGGNTGNVTTNGTISLLTSYVATDTNNNGILNGAFSSGKDRYGIQVTGGTFIGSIIDGSTGAITIQGNDSYGVWIDPTGGITGDLTVDGAVNVIGDRSVGVLVNGSVGGNLSVGSTITGVGVGAQGLVTSGPVNGAVTIQGTISASGYRSNTAPTNPTTLAGLSADEMEQGGSAVIIGGDVGNGLTIGQPFSTTTSGTTTSTSAGAIQVFGESPALQIGRSGASVTLGNSTVSSEPYGLVIGGTIGANGLYDPATSPNLPAPVSATAVLLGSGDQTGTTDFPGGVHIQSTGHVGATALSANATGFHITNGVSLPDFVNDGSVSAKITLNGGPPAPVVFNGSISGQTLTVASLSSGTFQVGDTIAGAGVAPGTMITAITGSGAATVYTVNQSQTVAAAAMTAKLTPQVNAIVIDSGANVPSIMNNRSISASSNATISGLAANVGAIVDYSGTLANVTNTGLISATRTATNNLFVTSGSNTAIDVRASSAGVNITQQQATPNVFTGAISGATLTVNSLSSPTAPVQIGQLITGPGVAANTIVTGLTGGTGGVGSTYSLTTSQTVASESLSAGPVSAVFKGSITGNILTATSFSSGLLQVGQTITGPGIAPNTTIIGDNGSSGGLGTYLLSISQAVSNETINAALTPSIDGDILLGHGHNVINIDAGRVVGAVTELPGESDLSISLNPPSGGSALLDITKAEAHPVASLYVGAGGVLESQIDPKMAVGGATPSPIFDTTAQGGTATFANGAQIGVTLTGLQAPSAATYVFVHTGGPGDLSVGTLDNTLLADAPFIYQAVVSQNGGDLNVDITRKTSAQLGFNASEAAAYDAIYAALLTDTAAGSAVVQQTTEAGFKSLYDQLVPDQSIGVFEALEATTQHISSFTDQPPDNTVHWAGTSLWLQEVNQRVERQTAATLGTHDKVFGLVGGLERSGAAGGGLGVTFAYLNIEDESVAAPVGGGLVSNLLEAGVYYRREWKGLRFAARGAGGFAWFDDHNQFLTTGLSEEATSHWSGFFGDAHADLAYELKLRRYYLRPELSIDYLYLSQNAHNYGPGTQVVNLSVDKQSDSRLSGAAIIAFGAQYGEGNWFRPEIFGGYREVFSAIFDNTVGAFSGGGPFSLPPGDTKGGWITVGFVLRAGTELSYLALQGDADFRDNEQRFDVFFAGRALF